MVGAGDSGSDKGPVVYLKDRFEEEFESETTGKPRACSLMVEYFACTEEVRVRLPAGPCFAKKYCGEEIKNG